MKKVLLSLSLLTVILTACPSEETKTNIEKDIQNTTNNVKDKLDYIDKKGAEKTKEFSDNVEKTSKDLGNKMDEGMKDLSNKTKDLINDQKNDN